MHLPPNTPPARIIRCSTRRGCCGLIRVHLLTATGRARARAVVRATGWRGAGARRARALARGWGWARRVGAAALFGKLYRCTLVSKRAREGGKLAEGGVKMWFVVMGSGCDCEGVRCGTRTAQTRSLSRAIFDASAPPIFRNANVVQLTVSRSSEGTSSKQVGITTWVSTALAQGCHPTRMLKQLPHLLDLVAHRTNYHT